MWSRKSGIQVLDLDPPPAGSASCSSDADSPVSSCVSTGDVHSQTGVDSLLSFDLNLSSTCSTREQLVHTWTCITPGAGQVSLQEKLSLRQKVQVNRRILQHLLTNPETHLADSQSGSREHNNTSFTLKDSEVLQRDDNNQSLFVAARLPRQQQFEDGACMKRRCVPLRADHNLLTPDTHTLSGVKPHPVVQVRSEGVASSSGHLKDLSSNQSTVGLARRHPPTASPPRRLRFEDETETEVESRYLERQRRWAGPQGTGVLVSKPDLNLYVNGRAGLQGVRSAVDGQHRGWTLAEGTALGSRVNLNLHLHPPVPEERGRSMHRPRLNLLTEPIRETYIGSVTPGQTSGGGGRDQVRRRANQVELIGKQVSIPQAMPATDLPINPYELTTPTQTISKCPSSSSFPSGMMSQSVRTNGTKAAKNKKQNQKDDGRHAPTKPHRELRSGAELKERSPCVEDGGMTNSSSSSSSTSSKTTGESRAPPTSDSSSDGHVRQPMRAELPSDEQLIRRDESSRLSLRRLFSSVTLSRTRTGSLDRLSLRPRPSEPDPAPLCPGKSSGLLKKTLSVQSLSVQGSPFLHLKKSSSVQMYVSDQKKKRDRSADYTPAADQVLQRCLSLEDVGRPSSVRSVGRVLQVCSDGTFLLEVHQPPKSRTYGFIISRGRGRQDTGVYVEDMVDGGTEKLYAGLLAVGDEILEVNGEKVACLSLDQVTRLLTQNTSATIRVLRDWTTSPR